MEILKYQLNCSILFQMPTDIQDRWRWGWWWPFEFKYYCRQCREQKLYKTSFKQAEITLMVLNNVGCYPHLNLNQSVASGLLGTVYTNIENSAMHKSISHYKPKFTI